MAARDERERLVGALAELQAEFCQPDALADAPITVPMLRPGSSLLDHEEEELVGELGRSLARLAAAAASAHPPEVPLPESVTLGTVGGAEWVMRWALEDGERERLEVLLPDFVYLVTLPYLGQQEALRLSRRARGLVKGSADGEGRADEG
jgi:hypothetical protein